MHWNAEYRAAGYRPRRSAMPTEDIVHPETYVQRECKVYLVRIYCNRLNLLGSLPSMKRFSDCAGGRVLRLYFRALRPNFQFFFSSCLFLVSKVVYL
jgi:hypothetical protein